MMDKLTPDVIAAAIVGFFVVFAGIGKYLKSLNSTPPAAPMIAGVGLELGNRQQMDQLIAAVVRIGDLIEGKKQSGMEDRIQHLSKVVEELLRKQ